MGFSQHSYLLASVVGRVNFYIFLLSLSAYINKPKAFTNTHLPASKSSIKVPFLSFRRSTEKRKRVVSSLSRLSENPGEITLSAAAVQRRVITNSNGCFYINGSLWRPFNEQIAGVKHLWKCHLRKRKEARGRGERRERGGAGKGFWSWQISAGQRWATVYLGPAIVFRELAVQGSVWISRVRCGLSEQTCTRTASPLPRADQCLSDLKDWHTWWKPDWDTKRKNARTRGSAEERANCRIRCLDRGRRGRRKRRGSERKNEAVKQWERWKQGAGGWKERKAKDKQTEGGRGRRKCCSSISAEQRESSGALNLAPIRGLMTVWSEELKRTRAF